MVQWVEKASLEKIHILLEVFEQERHCEVLLTLKNFADVKQSPAPYSLPIIPRSLPLEIVDGEHFVTFDLLSLLVGSAPSTGDPEAESLNREQASQTSFVPSTSTNGDSSSASPIPGRDSRGIRPTRILPPRERIGFAPQISKIRKRGTNQGKSTCGAQVEDFIPWILPEPSRSSDSEEEEEEEEMTGLLDCYSTRKRKRQEDVEREADRAEGSNHAPTDGGSETQEIVIPSSLEMGSNDQSGLEDIAVGSQGRVLQFLLHYKWSTLLTGQKAIQALLSWHYLGIRGLCRPIGYY